LLIFKENSNVGVQDDRPVNQQNVNKVADKEEDYAGDVEKPQQQQQQQQQQNDAVVGQVASKYDSSYQLRMVVFNTS
jgi:hypothetical protein